uniref:Cytochrome b5 heme-binding domain-containing protein n=1 Tax=Phaeomonas parva TaxID=124430 RepID=A0A6U4G8Y8_9STRA|mmetsp:Transcript_29402/g.94391  ORF Transcript_29402/g.94391 Transcript_29402/m.94391 type:complete len:501 (+) Transcript_29402:153-1655(+)|eukprot:CAMPEP_0118851566 /NCGR_PEP_ID=MMETSP1163-20130328/969_1 /TAXON_ID=124430 /ORGANISM="Phaeomonas parva, Strain CCMP2877" /LENGTH=500 /DNA_ID=CAMNT_0006783931 /DNA_START=115 /DNA_END=1617 /DNA_ORIENTATION=-
MCKKTAAPTETPAPAPAQAKRYTFDDMRAHATRGDAWITIHGKVYDVTEFAKRHPGGDIIYQGLAIDSTVLFETHHNMIPNMDRLHATMKKYYIGELDGWKPLANFKTPFAQELLQAVRDYVHKRDKEVSWFGRRWDALSYGSMAFIIFGMSFWVYKIATTGSLWYYGLMAYFMTAGHVCGHAANHYSLFESSFWNNLFSTTFTNLWGLREQYWTFSHLLSHHCYNYADRDYMIEQHVPTRYFRTRPEDPWKPINAYQHYIYRVAPAFAFFMGALRWDCAPWVFVAPIAVPILTKLGLMRAGESSVAAPQFTASGSTHGESELGPNEDGVGINKKFHVRESFLMACWSVFMANVLWLPLFVIVGNKFGYAWAWFGHSFCFGLQSAVVINTLLTQHLSEDIILKPTMEAKDDWYKMQIEASTSVKAPVIKRLLGYGINYQIEHHIFPCMSPQFLHEVQPIVEEVCAKNGVQYNGFPSLSSCQESVYKRFKNLSTKSSVKSE